MTVPDFATGKVLGGKYTLHTLLRRSPWAATYRATLAPGQELVVKVLDTALAEQQAALDVILRAGAAVAALPEPLVCQVVEHGKDPETGALFIVSRVAANPSLASILERGPLPAEAVVALMRSVGQAMDAAHATRLAHLALKPTNIFVGAAPAHPAQIGDFGANAIRTLVPDEVRQSFSAPWLAPEQIANDSVAGPSSDVFAAALVAFAALTAGSFWRSCGGAGPDVAAWRAEVIAPPARASQRASDLGVTLSPAFDAVFARALSVPQNRFPSVAELAKALAEAWEASRSTAARSPGQATAPGAGAAGADVQLGVPNTPGLQYAATVPQVSPAAEGALPMGADPGAAAGGAFAAGAPNPPAQGVAAPGVAGVTAVPADGPKKRSKAWIVIVLGVFLIGGAVGFVLFQRARANALAHGAAGISSDTVATGASAHAPGAASAEPPAASATAAASAAATGSAEPAAAAADTPEAGAAPAAAASTAEPEPVAPATAEAPATATAAAGGVATAAPPATATAVAVAPAQPGDVAAQPRKHDHPAAGTGPSGGGPTPGKKPCGKFLERCPDSGS